jgi:cytochrome c biogenesis protein CcmG/thiol:disulfide interchange protein DsbE
MSFVLRVLVLIIPISLIGLFFVLLSTENEYPGADYILNVWASWCITCMVEHPYLSKLSNNGIKIVGLNYKDDRSDALAWLNKFDNPYDLIIHDFKGTLALDLGVTGAPETFLVNNGKVVAHYQGEVNQTVWNEVFQPIINSKNLSLK